MRIGSIGKDIRKSGLKRVAEGRKAYSRFNLSFLDDKVEAAYLDYRKPRILVTLRVILLVGAALVFAGSAIDFVRLSAEDAMGLTVLRVVVCLGMLGAWWMTRLDRVKANLLKFIAVGTVLIHLVWLATAMIIGSRIAEYSGILPINLMLTFLVSGLMFRTARWIALAAGALYIVVLSDYHPAPLAPILYMAISGVYAGFAAYVAEMARRDAWAESQALEEEKSRTDQLLLNVLPPSIAARMKGGEELIADQFDDAAVLFADIVGFTRMSANLSPAKLVEILDDIFRRFDLIAEELDLEKIKTIGDCYMLACGLPRERRRDYARIAEAALRMKAELRGIAEKYDRDIKIRVGIHAGPVVAGVIGHSKFIYDLWGDTVNMASRLESTAPVGAIQVSEEMRDKLNGAFQIEYRGEVEMKGKGMQKAFLLVEEEESAT